MTKILLKIFVKNYKDINNPEVRTKTGNLASWTGILLNLILVVGKVVGGLIAGSVSVVADGLNNLMDAAGSVITLIGFKLSSKKADKEHPFGHGRYEYIAGLAVAVLVLIVGIELGKSSISKILYPTGVSYGLPTLLILIVSILIKIWMGYFSNTLGKRIKSTALTAVAVDSRNDVIATAAVFITALISKFFDVNLDGLAGLGVAIFIIYNGIILIQETLSPILGESPSQDVVDEITKKITSHKCVLGIHDLIIHDYGPGKQYASAHVELSSKLDPVVSHDLIDKIEKQLLEENNIHIVIHYDPVEEDM
ncbi:MAG: cation transporter [Clostridiales bacterium]|nr:cation transporter [Clostridiales bacterium]